MQIAGSDRLEAIRLLRLHGYLRDWAHSFFPALRRRSGYFTESDSRNTMTNDHSNEQQPVEKPEGVSDAEWDAAGCERFRYTRAGRVASIDYRRAPDAVHDDADAMRDWAMRGVAAGRRAAS